MQLSALVIGGWAASTLLRQTVPIGRDIGRSGDVATILNGEGSPMSGPPDASLHLAVFSDYRCPACRRAFPGLEDAIRKDADVRVIYKDWPIFGPPSERAARVALACAEQGIYPAVHRRLMTDSRGIDDGVLRNVVTEAGGDWTRTIAYLTTHDDQITALLLTNGQQALAIGLPGTPGYLAGPVLVIGAIDEADFTRLFARARAS
jgi:protein-disulfide isomerase